MKCPKCGQEAVNINNRHICTACGIVVDNFGAPKEQILGQLRSKVAPPKAPIEQYISPMQKARELSARQREEELDRMASGTVALAEGQHEKLSKAFPSAVPERKLPDFPINIAPDLQTNHHLKTTAKEEPVVQEIPKQEVPEQEAPKAPTVFPTHSVVEAGGQHEEIQLDVPEAKEVNIEPIHPDVVSENIVTPNVPVPEKQPEASAPAPPAPAITANAGNIYAGQINSKSIYPSHQVNPILLKILIFSLLALLIFAVVYLIYSSTNGFSGAGNISQFLGENLFK